MGIAVALVAHLLLLGGLASGMSAGDLMQQAKSSVVAVVLVAEAKAPRPKPKPEPPPEISKDETPAPRKLRRRPRPKPKIFVPKVEVPVSAEPAAGAISSFTEVAEEVTPPVALPRRPAPVPEPEMQPAPPAPKVRQVKRKARLLSGCKPPRYPRRSEERGEEGRVVFKFLVGIDGRIKSTRLVQSSGYSRLDDAAQKAFMRCSFAPGTIDGVATSSWVRRAFSWKLR